MMLKGGFGQIALHDLNHLVIQTGHKGSHNTMECKLRKTLFSLVIIFYCSVGYDIAHCLLNFCQNPQRVQGSKMTQGMSERLG